ncbi:MAG: PAC2 family protein [Propionibacteriaceae bacterium]
MMDPQGLYTVDDDVAASLAGTRPVLIHQLVGFVDAGQAGQLFSGNLLEQLDHEVLAVFDHDQLHDYRSRRPTMVFDRDHWVSAEEFHLRVHRMTDPQGETFLYLEGPEPDVQWERFSAAVINLVERFDVRMSATVHGIPMAVPHTRPITLTVHGTDPELTQGYRTWIERVEVPGSLSSLLEYRLGLRDRKSMGIVAHVPHYLAQAPFHEAAVTLTRTLNQATGLAIPFDGLEKSAIGNLSDINGEMAGSDEVQQLVSQLEAGYDAMIENQGHALPSADEIGAEFERFLAEQDKGTEGE